MTLMEHARRELDLLGDDRALATSLIAAVGAFTAYPHSGSSAAIAAERLARLLDHRALTPLTFDPDEWEDRSNLSGYPIWQNVRDSKAMSSDGGRTYRLLSDAPGRAARHSRVPMPWRRLLARQQVHGARATEAALAYLAGGTVADAAADLDTLSPDDRGEYARARWGRDGAKLALGLYTPPAAMVGLDG